MTAAGLAEAEYNHPLTARQIYAAAAASPRKGPPEQDDNINRKYS